MQEISGKTALVTGAANGIGLGIARALVKEGAAVAIADIDAGAAEKAAAGLREAGAKAVAIGLDVADEGAWARARDEVARALGPVRILCSNAGVTAVPKPVEAFDAAKWRWHFGVNMDAHFYAARVFLPEMKASGEAAHIVSTVSMAGLIAPPMSAPYNASKFAALGFAMTLRQELKGSRIGVSVLCPGFVATNLAATSRAQQGEAPEEAQGDQAFAAALSQGMPPDVVGIHVAEAVKAGRFYVFPHKAYRAVVDKIDAERRAAFAFGDTVYDDDVAGVLEMLGMG